MSVSDVLCNSKKINDIFLIYYKERVLLNFSHPKRCYCSTHIEPTCDIFRKWIWWMEDPWKSRLEERFYQKNI
jgi:hypothetical protein